MQAYRPKENKYLIHSEKLTSRLFFILTGLFIVFILFASLLPGSGPIPVSENILFRLKKLLLLKEMYLAHDLKNVDTFMLRDIAANVLLYIPLGIFLSSAVSRPKRRFFTPWLFLGTLISLLMENAQRYINRNPDMIDIITNTIGFLFGFWLVVFAMKFMDFNPATVIGLSDNDKTNPKVRSVGAFRFMYICIYFLVALLPFDISISPSQIYGKLFTDGAGQARIILDPFYHYHQWPQGATALFLSLLGLIPVAILTSFLDGLNKRLNPFSPISICLSLAMLSESAKIFILSRTTDIILFPIAILAGISGWFMIKMWFFLQDVPDSHSRRSLVYRKKLLKIALISYSFAICLFAWAPYQFELNPKIVAYKILYQSNFVPFMAHFSYHDLSAALDLVKETGIFVPLGLLITFLVFGYRPARSRLKEFVLAGTGCFIFGLLIELSQAVCLSRYIDVTDAILAGFGGISGCALFSLFFANIGKIE